MIPAGTLSFASSRDVPGGGGSRAWPASRGALRWRGDQDSAPVATRKPTTPQARLRRRVKRETDAT
jgi:hypothetical protein